MTRITLDETVLTELLKPNSDVQVFDQQGNLIGLFSPVIPFDLSTIPDMSEEEIREALKMPTKSTAEVLRDLEKLK